jgi:hypothetical protein
MNVLSLLFRIGVEAEAGNLWLLQLSSVRHADVCLHAREETGTESGCIHLQQQRDPYIATQNP